MRHHRTGTAVLVLLMLVASACSRSDDTTETEPGQDTTTTAPAASGDDATALDAGGFGDMEAVCQDGDASGATAPGVTDTTITVGTMTDKGGVVAGLNEEMYDTAVAFTKWCNDHGGILGRQLVLSDVDVKLFDYEPVVTEACGRDFALVGGGAVFDDDPNGVRVACDLPNIAGYVVSAKARVADLQVQPIPNPIYDIALGRYNAAKRDFPDSIDRYAIMASALDSVQLVKNQSVEVAESLGFKTVYSIDYQTQGETGWPNFVRDMQAKDVKVLEFVGQPQSMVELTQAMDTAGWYPDVILLSGNFYDDIYAKAGGDTAGNLYIQGTFFPFEMAEENKATQDYLDLMEQYNPSGKVALLGAQGLSSWLLFAQAATACGSELTSDCLLEHASAVKDWTAGGLHARQTPGNTVPSPCFITIGLDANGFEYDEAATAPTEGDGIFNCDDANTFDLKGDYGVPRPGA